MFDHHTHSIPSHAAIEEMQKALCKKGSKAQRDHYKSAIYDLIDAPTDAKMVLSSSREASNLQVIWSTFLTRAKEEGKTHFITSCVEDFSLLQPLKRVEELGCSVKLAPIDRTGRVDLEKLKALISPRTALISLSIAQGLTGVVQPLVEIEKIAKEHEIPLHLDATWSVGKIDVSFTESSASYFTFGGEKIHSILGTAALFAKKDAPLKTLWNDEPFNDPALAAFSGACRFAKFSLDSMGLETARLRNRLEEELIRRLPGTKVAFIESIRLPNTTTLLFPRVHHEASFWFLKNRGVFPNESGNYLQLLPKILSFSEIEGDTALSFSLSRMTTEEEVEKGISIIVETVQRLQKISEDLF